MCCTHAVQHIGTQNNCVLTFNWSGQANFAVYLGCINYAGSNQRNFAADKTDFLKVCRRKQAGVVRRPASCTADKSFRAGEGISCFAAAHLTNRNINNIQ